MNSEGWAGQTSPSKKECFVFDSPEALRRKIQLGEDSGLELKSVRFKGATVTGPGRKDLADELAAIANSNGGVLVLGVDDKTREIIGIPLEKLDVVEGYVREICNDSIDPPLDALITKEIFPDTKGRDRSVIKVTVFRSLFVHKSPRGYFRRLGSAKRELSPQALARLFQHRSQAGLIRFDEQSIPNTGLDDLDESLWRRFLPETDESPQTTLRKLKILSDDEWNRESVTVGGMLMGSFHPERGLPGALIEAVHYRGRMPDSHYQIDARTIIGPLDRQIDEALAFVIRNMNIYAVKEPARRDIPQYHKRAVFEALVNAVAHRDYSISGSKIRLFMFQDRLELYSPGGLPNTVTADSLYLRQVTRNELVTSLLARCAPGGDQIQRRYYLEKRGEGVPIILNESEALSGKKPIYREIDHTELLLTIFPAPMPHADTEPD